MVAALLRDMCQALDAQGDRQKHYFVSELHQKAATLIFLVKRKDETSP